MGNQTPGWLGVRDANTPFSLHQFQIAMRIARVRTATPVIVKAVASAGAADQWTVDVQPLVNQVDGEGNPQAHGTITKVPAANMGGANGSVSVKPSVGDLGFVICADRDMSSVVKTKAVANPGSRRMHALADAVYYGGFGALNTSAHQVLIDDTGITINSTKAVKINAPNGTTITGDVAVIGKITATAAITAGQGGADQVGLQTHTHASNGTPPTAGT